MKQGTSHTDEARAKIAQNVRAALARRRFHLKVITALRARIERGLPEDQEHIKKLAGYAAASTDDPAMKAMFERIERSRGRLKFGTFPVAFYTDGLMELERELDADPTMQTLAEHLEEHDA